MTTSSETPAMVALRLIEHEIEAVGFEIDREAQGVATSLERQLELRQRRKNLVRLYRMSGGEAAPINERIAQ